MIPTTITAFVTKRCNLRCKYCIAGCGDHDADILTEPELGNIVDWLDQFTPGADVHITGGEPLLRDIRWFVDALHKNGHRVSVFTNGLQLKNNLWLLDYPIAFHVTHHPGSGVSYDLFFKSISKIPKDRIIVARLYDGREAFNEKSECEKAYQEHGYKLHWMNRCGIYHNYGKSVTENPERTIALIGQNGDVYRCSNPKKGVLGNIYDMTFQGWPDERVCNLPGRSCNALLSAKLLGGVHDNFH